MKKERIYWIDFARAFAIASVLVVHCTERAFTQTIEELDFGPAVFRTICFVFGRLGVPLFFAISGYLLLDRDYSTGEAIKKFYRHNLIPLLITAEIWVVIYFLWAVYYAGLDLNCDTLIRNMLFVRDNEFGHFWYMPVILGLYFTLPFVSNAIRNIPWNFAFCIYAAYVLFYFLLRTVNIGFDISGTDDYVSSRIDLGFFGGGYGLYLLLGYFCKRGVFEKIPHALLWIVAILSFGATCYMPFLAAVNGCDFRIWYDFAGIYICSASLFGLFSKSKMQSDFSKRMYKFILPVSTLSFGIYLVHKPLLDFVSDNMKQLGMSDFAEEFIYFALSLAGSLLITYIISKIPKLRKWLIYLK